MAMRRDQITLTVGVAGTAVERTNIPVDGIIHAIHLNFSPAFDATTTVTIAELGTNFPALPILTLTNVNTDGWYYPRVTLHDVADGSEIVGPVDYQSVSDHLQVSIADGTQNDTLVVTFVWDDNRR